MGWGSGSEIARGMMEVIEALTIADGQKIAIYTGMIKVLRNSDWDTEDDVTLESRCFDRALFLTDPEYFVNDDYIIKEKGKAWMQFIKTGK
jgi:hypothetical protein